MRLRPSTEVIRSPSTRSSSPPLQKRAKWASALRSFAATAFSASSVPRVKCATRTTRSVLRRPALHSACACLARSAASSARPDPGAPTDRRNTSTQHPNPARLIARHLARTPRGVSTHLPLVSEAADAVLVEAEKVCNFVHDRTPDLVGKLLGRPAGTQERPAKDRDVIRYRVAVVVGAAGQRDPLVEPEEGIGTGIEPHSP